MSNIPPILDYSDYVTLIRNQDGCGGCGSMATLHAFDIQMERIAPYTPDASYAFNSFVFSDSMGHHPTSDPRIGAKGLDQTGVLMTYGSCPEAIFPTTCEVVGPSEPAPPDSAFEYARRYRVLSRDKKLPTTIAELKQLLHDRGPLIFNHTPEGASEGHVVTLIGYNDSTQKIKYINSIAASTGWDGIREQTYDYFLGRLACLSGDEGVYCIDVGSENPDRYTARVRVTHFVGRRYLAIRIGVKSPVIFRKGESFGAFPKPPHPNIKAPVTVWDHNCSVNMLDDTKDLAIDVPLPAYAEQYWPPTEGNWWYIEVIDTSPPGSPATVGYLEQVVLVERRFVDLGPGVHHRPLCIPTLYDLGLRHVAIQSGVTLRVDIP